MPFIGELEVLFPQREISHADIDFDFIDYEYLFSWSNIPAGLREHDYGTTLQSSSSQIAEV